MARTLKTAWLAARHSLQHDGAKATWARARLFASQRVLKASPDLVQHRFLLSSRIADDADFVVQHGPFSGTRLAPESWWSAADRGSMVLGFYEKEVLDALVGISADARVLVDVGAADGYYAAGALVGGLVERAVCFEMSAEGRDVIRVNAERNGIADRIVVRGLAGTDFLNEIPAADLGDGSECVFLFDIEGGEFDLLTEGNLARIARSRIIIEIHEAFEGGSKAEELTARAAPHFDIEVLRTGARDPGALPELASLNDDDRWLLCSESRGYLMRWLVLTPRTR